MNERAAHAGGQDVRAPFTKNAAPLNLKPCYIFSLTT
jgi:hypothetical protein